VVVHGCLSLVIQLVFLDEATSALDKASEMKLYQGAGVCAFHMSSCLSEKSNVNVGAFVLMWCGGVNFLSALARKGMGLVSTGHRPSILHLHECVVELPVVTLL
jgi:hypothetical protein